MYHCEMHAAVVTGDVKILFFQCLLQGYIM